MHVYLFLWPGPLRIQHLMQFPDVPMSHELPHSSRSAEGVLSLALDAWERCLGTLQ